MINTRNISDDVKELLNTWPIGWTFDLPSDATVIVAGSYKGRVMDLIDQVYSPKRIIGFDPAPWACEVAADRMVARDLHSDFIPRGNNYEIHQYGIGTQTGVFPMGEWETDGCSFVHVGGDSREQGRGEMREMVAALDELNIGHVDLVIFNMEGYEFNLLPYMLDAGMLGIRKGSKVALSCAFDRLCVQFHHGFGNDGDWPATRERIEQTHEVQVDNYPQWISWRARI